MGQGRQVTGDGDSDRQVGIGLCWQQEIETPAQTGRPFPSPTPTPTRIQSPLPPVGVVQFGFPSYPLPHPNSLFPTGGWVVVVVTWVPDRTEFEHCYC